MEETFHNSVCDERINYWEYYTKETENTIQKKLKEGVRGHLSLGTSTQNSQTEFQ